MVATVCAITYSLAQIGEWLVHGLIWIAALWAVTFPGATWSLALLFHRAQPTGRAQPRGGVALSGAA